MHPEVIYHQLFQAVWSTLEAFGQKPKRLGGQMGMSAVLHTWRQNLSRHVHLHCLVPGGALGADGQWKACKGNYLFPVKALSRHFCGEWWPRCARRPPRVACIDCVPAKSTPYSIN